MLTRDICRCISTAFDWHGGGGSPLYRFASTRRVQDQAHKWGLEIEIKRCMLDTDDPDEGGKLNELLALTESAEYGRELCKYADMVNYWEL